jgi:hypothetical protein
VARQDAIVDAALVQREAHVRAAVINGIHLVMVCEKCHDMLLRHHSQTAGGLQFGQGGHAYPPVACGGLGVLLKRQSHTTPPSPHPARKKAAYWSMSHNPISKEKTLEKIYLITVDFVKIFL